MAGNKEMLRFSAIMPNLVMRSEARGLNKDESLTRRLAGVCNHFIWYISPDSKYAMNKLIQPQGFTCLLKESLPNE